ncbi:MAG: AbrB/MazE/SpoVT family DNA-binding domain-containing protein [Thaumarchaeota archaeon]|nr:AbrB/MazE/SpoVT family DNA-binding domain-containing protein [Nitrososphaerota archaeon]
MNTVKVSKKYQVVIPENLRHEAHIKPGDKMMVIAKHGILQYVPIHSIKETKGMIRGLDVTALRDKTDRI